MNRSALKNYAPKARLDFIRAVTDRAALFGLTPQSTEPMKETGDVVMIGGRAFPKVVASQRRSLEGRIQRQGFDQVMEAMAYTWFNRLVALRYMELHGYLDHGYRVLSHAEGKDTPEILEHAEHVTLPGLDAHEIINLKLDGSREAELYRLLLVAQCNALNDAMPFLFERIADETELLLPDNLLHSDSVIRKLVKDIDEADWQQVEIIGWLYQFYISDKKAEVIGKVVKSEDIPAATQLFTPNWIVKYLVQNTLGRQWLASYPDSPLRQQMEYYIEPAEQTNEVKAQLSAITPKSIDPEKLTLLDPACGSAHILVEAYDLFKAIYQERGYRSKDIPQLILEKNLFGLEIDDRAAQLAAFALLMKARADDRLIFADRIQPNVLGIQESKELQHLLRPDPAAATAEDELPFSDSQGFSQTEKQQTLKKPTQGSPLAMVEPCLRELVKVFDKAKTLGSLIWLPPQLTAQLPTARQSIEAMVAKGQLWERRAAELLLPLVNQAEFLSQTYTTVVTNPPYLGNKGMNESLREFAKHSYPESKSDVFAVFAERILNMVVKDGFVGLMTPFTWMFIKSYEHLRIKMTEESNIMSLIQPEYHAFFDSAYVPICAFVVQKSRLAIVGDFIKLTAFYGEDIQPVKALEAIRNAHCAWRFKASSEDFKKIPGSPIAYWISDSIRNLFDQFPPLGDIAEPRKGMVTADNPRFIRLWHEVSLSKIGFSQTNREMARRSRCKWFPYQKGGSFRRWYGNHEYVVNWENDGYELLNMQEGYKVGSTNHNLEFIFQPALVWTKITSAEFSFRLSPPGFLFDDASGLCPVRDPKRTKAVLGLLNSPVTSGILKALNPTLNLNPGNLATVPFIECDERTSNLIDEAINISKRDWDSFENSWDFTGSPILRSPNCGAKVESGLINWAHECNRSAELIKSLEDEINRFYFMAYALELEPDTKASEGQIVLESADCKRDVQRLISYGIGCMMGRYSLDKPGLVYANSRNEGFDPSQYTTFPADADGIIPITELAWFSDDATERFVDFISKAWPREHLEENLKFLADSLGPNRDEHPRDTIRRYLGTGFYKDHLQTYKRRPIYWLFSSGKQRAFQCLVYLHRYHEGTLARMRTEYVIPLQGKLSQRIEQLAGDSVSATSTSHRRKLEKERETLVKQRTELAAFDEKLRHYADQRIAIDLDDGVKVNYGKFGDLLAEVKAVTGGGEE